MSIINLINSHLHNNLNIFKLHNNIFIIIVFFFSIRGVRLVFYIINTTP